MPSIDVNTNYLSLVLQNQLTSTTKLLNSSMEKLSTGKKINHAADGAAQLAISSKMQAQISGTKIAQENTQQGKLMLDQADSSLQQINENLVKLRDLAVQASNGTLSSDERAILQIEAQGYIDQINAIAKDTEFSGLTLLDGSLTDLKLQVGANKGDTLDISKAFTDASASAMGLTSTVLNTAFSSATNASKFIETVDAAVTTTSTKLATVGAYSNSLDSTLEALAVRQINYEASNAEIIDVDYAAEMSKYVQLQVLQQAQISLVSQANMMPSYALSLLQG